jgi:hypothetical protein
LHHLIPVFTSVELSAKESSMIATQESLSEVVLEHLCKVINEVELSSWPYSHFYLEKAFPDEVFKEMLRKLPAASAYGGDNPRIHTREDGLITRNILSLSRPGPVNELPDEQRQFWSEIGDALTSPRLKQVVFNKLSKDLSRRFRIRPDQLDSVAAYPKPALVKDLGGYEIAPHKDTRSKIVTMQFYLPQDMSKADLGTAVYRQRLFQLKNLVSLRNRFETVKQFPFAPNSGYGFAVGQRSWHGRGKVPMASGERNSLMLIYYAQPGKGW